MIPRQPGRRPIWREFVLVGLALALLALWQTAPLYRHLSASLPYVYNPAPGSEVLPLVPGDHLQTYMWFWMLTDNLRGPSSLLTNPYEFNSAVTPHGLPLYANFPFSLLYLPLAPLGGLTAYNLLVLGSYLLAGLAAFGLARRLLGSPWPALVAALAFAFLPFRASRVLSGHMFGFVAFLLPLCLWALEESWEAGKQGRRLPALWLGAGAGAYLAALAPMESHLVYYTCLLLGLYVPLRLTQALPPGEDDPTPPPLGLGPGLVVFGAATALGFTVQAWAALAHGLPLWSGDLGLTLAAYLVVVPGLWLGLAAVLRALTTLTWPAAAGVLAWGLAPLLLAPLGLAAVAGGRPGLAGAWLGLLALAGLVLLAQRLWLARAPRGPRSPRRSRPALRPAPWYWLPLPGLVAGLGFAAAFMLHRKAVLWEGSIVGKGRGLAEVALFAPGLTDLLHLDPAHSERLIYPGLAGLLALAALLWLALGWGRGVRGRVAAGLWLGLAALFTLLCLGPTLGSLPLYQFLYQHLPFFNFPRVPGRLIVYAVLFMALAGGWVWREAVLTRLGRWGGVAASLALAALLAWDFWPATPPGLCLVPPPGRVTQAVLKNLPTGPAADARLLHLPIWPGDSHQSSLYELLITRTRALTVNGYGPAVPLKYLKRVFTPLYALDYGQFTPGALAALTDNQVGLVVFHDNAQVYTRKIGPFPPALTRERLAGSGRLTFLAQEGNALVYRLGPPAGPDYAAGLTSPWTAVWPATWLKRRTGQVSTEDGREVARARAGQDRPGYLAYGPQEVLPPGAYLVRFRLRRGSGGPPGRVSVWGPRANRELAAAALTPQELPADGAWHEVALAFQLKDLETPGFRVEFSGKADLDLAAVLLGFFGEERGRPFYPAARMWRDGGDLTPDPLVPGHWAVSARPGWTPAQLLMTGPHLTLDPTPRRALFRLALGPGPAALTPGPAAEISVTWGPLRQELARGVVQAGELTQAYQDFALDFTPPARGEVEFLVRYQGGAPLLVAGAGLAPPAAKP
ncbi:MAG: hypothetical protein KQJ78_04330 [Deltaproteobacteria bacterium]|nr:hypothetical protein [Deltaproteobacteria bacterium]